MGNNTEKVWVGLFAIFCFIVLIVAFCGCNSPKRLSREAWCEDHAGAPMVSQLRLWTNDDIIVDHHSFSAPKDVTLEDTICDHIYVNIAFSYQDSIDYGMMYSIGTDWKPCVCIKCEKINICK